MARAITMERDLPAFALPTVELIKKLGFGWRFIDEHRLITDVSRRVQVRDSAAVAPPREVARYAAALRRGDLMPPMIVTKDGYLVDGATRNEAAKKVGWFSFPAFQLDVEYEDAPDVLIQALVTLGSAFNLTHGRGMTPTNIEHVIDAVASDDDSPSDIARKLHVSESTVSTVINSSKARKRSARLGVELTGVLPNSTLKLFGGKSSKFTDPVFASFIALAQDARLTYGSVNDLSKRLEAAGTEERRMEMLREEREILQEVINGASNRPSKAGYLRRSIGYILQQEDMDAMVEWNPKVSGRYLAEIWLAVEKLQKVAAAQRRVEQKFARISEAEASTGQE